MIAFEQFQIRDGSPIYMQIVDFVERGIAGGIIEDGDELPSRRMLSALLSVNPNTVQKAYRILEERGIIESRSGAKSCVTADGAVTEKIRTRLLASDLTAVVQNMKQMRIDRDTALRLLSAAWDQSEEGEGGIDL